ncbi:hypothetical protein [Ureaplasma ceti]|uniref:Uncharacterized protein n=1 Tax=Ureaplasma ceti TaxID=3119530 RepID=A0ABP9U768_9BACT
MVSVKNSKTLNEIEAKLRVPEHYKRIWIIIGFVTLCILALTAIPLASLYAKLPQTIANNVAYNWNFTIASKVIVFVSYGVVCVPYLYLTASWIVGVDNITKSKYFHLLIWVVYSIAITLIILAIIFCYRAWMF